MKKIFLLLVSITPFISSAQNTALPLDPAVRTGKLANGFTYYIRHNEEPRNRVLLYLVNKAGSVLEDEDQRGLAHFMEHMNFNGTRHFPHNELVDYLQKAGVRFGADINAYTSFDETVYELPLPTNKAGILTKGMLIMHDWAQHATLDPAEIDKERGVVLEEKRLAKGAGERMQRIYWPVILNNSRYATRVPIGLDTVLNNFKRPQIARFYHDWYRPDLQALVIVGDVNIDSLEKVVRAQFSDLKNPAQEKVRTKYTVPLTGRNQFVSITDKEMNSTSLEVLIKHRQATLKTAEDYRKAMIQKLFNQMLGERYAELSRHADPPFISASAGISGFIGGLDIYDANLEAKPGELEKGFKALWRETARVKRFGFTATELQRAKAAYLSGLEEQIQEKDKTASINFVKEYQAYFLKGTAAPGILAEAKLTRAAMPTITLREVNDLGKEYITGRNRDILIMAPDKDKAQLPGEVTVNQWLSSVEDEKLLPYQDEVSTLPLLAGEPAPGHIISEEKNAALNMTFLTLSNGVRVILKPTAFKNDEILFKASAPGGTSLYSDADFQSAANAGSIIPANGFGNYTPDQLDKYMQGKQFSVQPYIGERYQGVSGSSSKKDLEYALQMIYAEFTEPRKDSIIFKGIIGRGIASLTNRGSDPESAFSDTVSAVLGNYNVRRTGPSLEKLSQVSLDRAYAIYKERFADAANFTFTFVGSIDTTTIKPLLEKYLGGLPSTHANETAKNLHIHIPPGQITKNVYKGTEPKSTVLLVYSGNFDYNGASKVKLDALKEALEIRLLERLREDESGVYSPGVYANAFKYPEGRFSLIIEFGCAPQNVDKLIASTLDEASKLKTAGPQQANIDKWRNESLREREAAVQSNSWWLNYLVNQQNDQEPLSSASGYPELLKQVTPDMVKAAAGQYMGGENFIRMVLLPENPGSK